MAQPYAVKWTCVQPEGGCWKDIENNCEVHSYKLNSYYENKSIFNDERMFASDFENYCLYRDGSNSVYKEVICNSVIT